MVEVNFGNLYYYISQALLGYITSNIKAISVKYDEIDGLFLYVYLVESPTEVDKENMLSALSEAESMFSKRINYDVKFIVTDRMLLKNDKFDFWVFMRYESEDNLLIRE